MGGGASALGKKKERRSPSEQEGGSKVRNRSGSLTMGKSKEERGDLSLPEKLPEKALFRN